MSKRTDRIRDAKEKGVYPRIAHSAKTGRTNKVSISTISDAYRTVCNDVYEILRIREAPLTVLLGAMHYHWGLAQLLDDKDAEEHEAKVKEIKIAAEYAQLAAPYIHPRLTALAVADQSGGRAQISGDATEIKISFVKSNEESAMDYLTAATTEN